MLRPFPKATKEGSTRGAKRKHSPAGFSLGVGISDRKSRCRECGSEESRGNRENRVRGKKRGDKYELGAPANQSSNFGLRKAWMPGKQKPNSGGGAPRGERGEPKNYVAFFGRKSPEMGEKDSAGGR